MKAPALGVLVLLTLGGCQGVPHAPVIYSSKWSVGLVAEQAANDPLPVINLGVQIDDAAWIPVIACTKLTAAGTATDGVCSSRTVYADIAGTDKGMDAFSVYGTFHSTPAVTGRTAAAGTNPAVPLSASLTAGKVFATGVAADQIASANGPTLHKVCVQNTLKDLTPATTLDELNKSLAICDVGKYEKP